MNKLKKVFALLLCVCMIMCVGVCFVGCEKQYTTEEILQYYSDMKTNDETKQFFNNNALTVTFDESVDGEIKDENKAGYILTYVYQDVLNASNAFLSYKINKTGLKLIVDDFSQQAKNEMYNLLVEFNGALKEFAEVKSVYEHNNGSLKFTKLLNQYNNILEKSFNLSFCFAENYYINGVGARDYSSATFDVSDSDCKEMLYFNNMILGEAMFKFSIKSYDPGNPTMPISTWLNQTDYMTTYLNDYLDVCKQINNVSSVEFSVLEFAQNPTEICQRLRTLQNSLDSFLENRELYYQGIENFNFNKYFKQTNKPMYIMNCSNLEQSNFNVVDRFLKDRFTSRLFALESFYSCYISFSN